MIADFINIQVELSRATLEFSFNSANNISGQNIYNLFGLIKYLVVEDLGLKKVWSQKFEPDELIGPHFFWIQTKFGPKKLIRLKKN